jgi:prepilin-type processing-associated H-X9-DG protein
MILSRHDSVSPSAYFVGQVPYTPEGGDFKSSAILNAAAFVFLSDVRARSTETPFYGSNPAKEIGCSHCWVAQMSSRHSAGANLNFADGQLFQILLHLLECGYQSRGSRSVGHQLDLQRHTGAVIKVGLELDYAARSLVSAIHFC